MPDAAGRHRAPEHSEILQLLASSPAIPHDHALHAGADALAVQLVRGYPPAIALSDLFAEQRVTLPLLNWPKAALAPLRPPASLVGSL